MLKAAFGEREEEGCQAWSEQSSLRAWVGKAGCAEIERGLQGRRETVWAQASPLGPASHDLLEA